MKLYCDGAPIETRNTLKFAPQKHPSGLDDWAPDTVLFDDDDFDSDVPVEMDTSFSHDHCEFVSH